MSSKLRRIEINFPVPVDLPDDFQKRLVGLVDEVCKTYEANHPGRVMWPFGVGCKITHMPLTREQEEAGEHLEFDEDTLEIEVSERERYHRWFVPKGTLSRLGECCRVCGVVRRADDENSPCRGRVSVGPRADSATEPCATCGLPVSKDADACHHCG